MLVRALCFSAWVRLLMCHEWESETNQAPSDGIDRQQQERFWETRTMCFLMLSIVLTKQSKLIPLPAEPPQEHFSNSRSGSRGSQVAFLSDSDRIDRSSHAPAPKIQQSVAILSVVFEVQRK